MMRRQNSERQKRKDEAAAGTSFQLRLFNKLANDPEYKHLAALCKHKVRKLFGHAIPVSFSALE